MRDSIAEVVGQATSHLRGDKALDVRGCNSVECTSVSHPCPACLMHWPLPRKIKWPPVATPPPGLYLNSPTTAETLVVYQTFDRKGAAAIPANVFQTFTFATEGNTKQKGSRNLVQGLRYSKVAGDTSPRISCDISRSGASILDTDEDSDRNHAYLRLMHLNNWYWLLFSSMSNAMMMTLEIQANVMMSAALLSDKELMDALGVWRWAFIGGWGFMLMVSVWFAYKEACVEWILKTSPQKGDLISNCSWWSRFQTLVAMVLFEFFLVEKDVKDMPIALHPWKGVQDYAAFKAEGHRAFFIGYRSKTMHRIENIRSIWYCLPQQLLTKVAVLTFKCFLMYKLFIFEVDGAAQHKVSYSLVVSTLTSLSSVICDSANLLSVYRVRTRFYKRLISRLRRNETQDSQYRADVRLLALHFRRRWEPERGQTVRFNRSDLRRGDWISFNPFEDKDKDKKDEKCNACGRKSSQKRDMLERLKLDEDAERPHLRLANSSSSIRSSMGSLPPFCDADDSSLQEPTVDMESALRAVSNSREQRLSFEAGLDMTPARPIEFNSSPPSLLRSASKKSADAPGAAPGPSEEKSSGGQARDPPTVSDADAEQQLLTEICREDPAQYAPVTGLRPYSAKSNGDLRWYDAPDLSTGNGSKAKMMEEPQLPGCPRESERETLPFQSETSDRERTLQTNPTLA